MRVVGAYRFYATFIALCDGFEHDGVFEDDTAISLLQLRATSNISADSGFDEDDFDRKHSAGRYWWKDQGCRANLGSDVSTCRLKSDVHIPTRWGTPASGDNHQRGFRLLAQTVDESLTAHVFQCPWDRSASTSLVSGLAMKIGEHTIECLRPPDCHQYVWCTVDGEDISYGLFPRTWDDGLYIERGSHDHLCIDSPDMKSSVSIVFKSLQPFGDCDMFKRKSWFEVEIHTNSDNAVSDDQSLCGGTGVTGQSGVQELTCEDSLFSAEACGMLCNGCDWGSVDTGATCDNLPDPDATPPSEDMCADTSCSYEHAQQACSTLESHSEAYEGCLLDLCSGCESDEEEDEIAAIDVEDEETANPGPACVDAGDTCGLPTDICTNSVKLNTMTVSQNNLAGDGPDSGLEEVRYSKAAAVGGKVIDLVVKAVGGSYTGNADKNGKHGEFGQVNMKSGANVELEFSFVDTSSGEPVTLDAVALSFFDLDEGKKGKSRTTITACEARNAILTTNTELSVARPENCYAVASTQHGRAANNPSSPLRLSADQAGRSVTFDFEKVSSLRVTLAISKGFGQRNTFWAFEPALACLGGIDDDLPLVPAAPVDANAPSAETCPLFTLGDGKRAVGGDTECNVGGQGTFSACVDACARSGCGHNGITSGAGIEGSGSTVCFCEKNQVGTIGSKTNLNAFCPPWMPKCNLDLVKECKEAQMARGGLSGATMTPN